jgi:hypothetical protein
MNGNLANFILLMYIYLMSKSTLRFMVGLLISAVTSAMLILALRNGAPDGEAFALVAEVPLGTTTTLYSRLGDVAGWITLAALAFFMFFRGRISMRFEEGGHA